MTDPSLQFIFFSLVRGTKNTQNLGVGKEPMRPMKSNFPSNLMILFIKQIKEAFHHPKEQVDSCLGLMLKGAMLLPLWWTLI